MSFVAFMAKPKLTLEQQLELKAFLNMELEMVITGELSSFTTNAEFAEIYNCCSDTIGKYIPELISGEDYDYRKSKIRSYVSSERMKRRHKEPEFKKANRERARKTMKALFDNPEFQEAHKKRAKESFLITTLNVDPEFQEYNRERSRETMRSLHKDPEFQRAYNAAREKLYTDPEFQKANRERARETMNRLQTDPEFQEAHNAAMEKLHSDPAFKKKLREARRKRNEDPNYQIENRERGRQSGIRTCESHRKSAYFIEKRFYASSLQEGAVALLLEKYILGYNINEGKNFQVKNRGIKNGGIDFLLNGEFFEWHPIILSSSREIPTIEEQDSYKSIRKSLPYGNKIKLDETYRRVLAVNYRNLRQASIDNSEYSGAGLTLATNAKELYSFISRFSSNLPGFSEFKKEFEQKQDYVRSFKVARGRKLDLQLQNVAWYTKSIT